MNTRELVPYLSAVTSRRSAPTKPIAVPSYHQLIAPLRGAVVRARQYLFSRQDADGAWRGRVLSDTSLASGLVLTLAYLDQQQSELAEGAAAAILDQQLPLGGWSRTPDGPVDLSTSVQAYFALKLMGRDPVDARLSRARDAIRRLGGADAANATTRFFLALLGQVGYDCCTPMPPESLLLPQRYGTHLHRLMAPLAIVWSHRPVRDVGLARGVRELFIKRPSEWPTPENLCNDLTGRASSARWQRSMALAWRQCERRGWLPLRRRALERAERLIVKRVLEPTGGQPTFDELLWLSVALETLGYDVDSPARTACEARLHDRVPIDDATNVARPQLASSPCLDTAAAVESLCASGVALDNIASGDAVGWLPRLERRCGLSGTTMELAGLLSALACVDGPAADAALPPAMQLADEWSLERMGQSRRCQSRRRLAKHAAKLLIERLLARQNDDGGWSVDDGGRRPRLRSAPDVTSAALDALSLHGHSARHAAIDRAISYLRSAQRADGSWDSATGVRLVHGTSLAVRGLVAAGLSADDPAVAAGANWLAVHQQPSGGWGEAANADDANADYVPARPTATQTAWALLALSAAGQATHDAAYRGVHFLLETQEDDGRWDEPHFTLRDPASDRWYRNDLYSVTGPLAALSRWAVTAAARQARETGSVRLRLVGVETT